MPPEAVFLKKAIATCDFPGRGSQGLYQRFWEKATGQNWEKMIDLTSKLGEINGIEYNKGRNISSKSSYFRSYFAKHTT